MMFIYLLFCAMAAVVAGFIIGIKELEKPKATPQREAASDI